MSDEVQFGRYRLVSLLGEGGMARVYAGVLAGAMGFEKKVALKLIDPSVTADDRVAKALINEARLGGRLHHKNIVEIYDFGILRENFFIAMELVEGWTVHDLLKYCRSNRKWLPVSVGLEIMTGTLEALSYAHSLEDENGAPVNLVHRDLKPGNLIVSKAGEVKVMDFGIAKADTNMYQTTDADVTKGTPIYMSPEQVCGDPLDHRSDLFAMGSVLHELITLQVPFQGRNVVQIMHGVMSGDLTEPIARLQRRCPPLVKTLTTLMAKDPDDRYPDARAALKHLREVGRELPPGPTLDEWLHEIREELPAHRTSGDFGPKGPPISVLPEDSTGSQPMAAVQTGSADTTGTAAAVPATRRKKKKKTKKKKGLPGAVIGAAAALLLVVLGAVVVPRLSATSEEPIDPAAAGATDPEPDGAATAAATPEPESTAEPEATPEAEATPKPKAKVAAAAPRPTPAPTPKATPAPAQPSGRGFLMANSNPWSTVSLDGRELGISPIQNYELDAGNHTLVFDCTVCEPAEKRTQKITIQAGETLREVVVFGQ